MEVAFEMILRLGYRMFIAPGPPSTFFAFGLDSFDSVPQLWPRDGYLGKIKITIYIYILSIYNQMRNCVGKQAQQLTWFELSYSDMPSSPFMSASDTNSPSTHMSVSDTFSRIRFWLRLIINSWQGQRGIGLVWSRLTSVTFFWNHLKPQQKILVVSALGEFF